MEKILVSPLGSPLSRWLGGPHSFDDEIKKLGEQFRIPLICLDDVTEVLPGKCYDVSIGFNYKRKWKIFEKSKETMNYFGIVFCRSKPEDLQLNRFCSDVYQIGVLAKLGDLNSDVDSSLFSFKSLGRFKILGIHHLAEG